MEFMTVTQAGEMWGISSRQVQTLCRKGKVPGAVRFAGTWAIPEGAPKPRDGRRKGQPECSIPQTAGFRDEKKGIFEQIVEQFPYGIQVFSADGTLAYANKAFFDLFLISDGSQMIGKMNLFSDEVILTTEMKNYVLRALSGESVSLTDKPASLNAILSQYSGEQLPTAIRYADILALPLKKDGRLEHLIIVFRKSREYEGRLEYIRAKEYIDNHWERFDLDAAAKASGLSRNRLTKVFKDLASITPSEYCMRVKINHIKEKLLDPNLSVAQAFSACGADYSGYYARIFKQYAGQTPLQYRKSHR